MISILKTSGTVPNSKVSARLSLLVQQLIHALLCDLTDPSSAKKVPSTPWMRLQVWPYVAPFSLCTCRMPWHRAGRELEEEQGSLKALCGLWYALSSCPRVSMGMGPLSCTAHQPPETPRTWTKSQTCVHKAALGFFWNFLLLSLAQLWFYHHHQHYQPPLLLATSPVLIHHV